MGDMFRVLAGLAEKRTHWNQCISLSVAGRLEQRADLRMDDSEQFGESVKLIRTRLNQPGSAGMRLMSLSSDEAVES